MIKFGTWEMSLDDARPVSGASICHLKCIFVIGRASMCPLTINVQKHGFDARNAFNGRYSMFDGHLTLRVTPMLISIHHYANAIIIPFASTLHGQGQGRRPSMAAPILRSQ